MLFLYVPKPVSKSDNLIDIENLDSDCSLKELSKGGGIDVGAYEGKPQASMSLSEADNVTDFEY